MVIPAAGALGEEGPVETDNGAWTGLDTSLGVTGAELGLFDLIEVKTF